MVINLNGKSLVMTEDGLKAVSDLTLNNKVLGSNKKFIEIRKITPSLSDNESIFLKGHGHPEFITNSEVLFFSSNYNRVLNEDTGKTERDFVEPIWIATEEMKGYFWSSPTKFPKGNSPENINENLSWILGAFLAGGHIVGYDIYFLTNHHREDELREKLKTEGFWLKKKKKGSIYEYYITHAVFSDWIKRILPNKKDIPYWLYGENNKIREAFFNGFVWGNGIFEDDSYKLAVKNNKSLAIGIKLISQTLGHSTALHLSRSGKKKNIERWQITGELSARSSTLIKDNRFGLVRDVLRVKRRDLFYELDLDGNRKGIIVDGLIIK